MNDERKSPQSIEVQTVEEVERVEPESVQITLYPTEGIIGMLQSTRWRDVQTISFPTEKAEAIANALLSLAQQGSRRD